ncbi:sigma factor-like helix-turn-helix DNA-binding protein [Bifidobacterium avesanii]|uniref:RNA polymerase sigma-70 region 4 domain-containing protein n=1 Tax=Bifidobacterium avesanii TaxID=1798157 RepID=A0A7K3TJR0_9BIFI|nr:sigma factor-like helix-turn-helix DNA-binding protein [Bifidobacterium avesanii]KAB8287254.1 RNA polymerase subunit sigma [Bifidobacterium avesanii]NEG79358.1 hypothetical protein [Bifidobacterium avesanii]
MSIPEPIAAQQAERPGILPGDDSGEAPIFDVWTDLDAVAVWARANGRDGLKPFLLPVTDEMPDRVRQAAERLNAYTMGGLFSHDPMPDDDVDWRPESDAGERMEPMSLAQSVEHAVNLLDEREFEVLARRVMLEQPETVEEVAERCSISREKVRRIEKSVRLRLQAVLETYRVEEKLEALFDGRVPFMTTVQACVRMPELGERLEGLSTPLHRLIRNVCGTPFEVRDGWVASPTLMFARQAFLETLRGEADGHGVVSPKTLDGYDILTDSGVPTGTVARWLAYCGVVVVRGHAIVCAQLRDVIEAILFVEGRPMTSAEIAALLSDDDTAAVETDLRADPRLVGVGGGRWTLRG